MSNTAPLGYKRVEYLESTGTQYIDTGFYANQDTKIIVDYIVKSIQTSNNGFIFGSRISNQNQNLSFTFDYNVMYIGRGSRYDAPGNISTTINTKYKLEYAKNYVKRNDVIIDSQSASDFTSTNSLHIFNCNENGSNIRYVQAKIYSFKIYDNDILVRDYIPVLNENNEAGLYDLVNKEFYENSGTGSFQYGNIIPEGTIAEKFNYSLEAKELIKDGINYLGGNVTDETTLKEYRDELDSVYSKLPKVTNSTASSSVTLNPTLKGRIDSTLKGQIGQDTTNGNQLINFASKTATGYSFTNDTLVYESSQGAYAGVQWDITDTVKNNPGKKLKFSYESIDISNQAGTIVALGIGYNDGTPAVYPQMLGHDLTNTSYQIANDISNISFFGFRIFANGTSDTTSSHSVTIVKPQLQFGETELPYEKYTGRNCKSKSKL